MHRVLCTDLEKHMQKSQSLHASYSLSTFTQRECSFLRWQDWKGCGLEAHNGCQMWSWSENQDSGNQEQSIFQEGYRNAMLCWTVQVCKQYSTSPALPGLALRSCRDAQRWGCGRWAVTVGREQAALRWHGASCLLWAALDLSHRQHRDDQGNKFMWMYDFTI